MVMPLHTILRYVGGIHMTLEMMSLLMMTLTGLLNTLKQVNILLAYRERSKLLNLEIVASQMKEIK